MNRTAHRQQHPNHRSGFSLLELLAAIVIIAILISLLFPAINAVRRRAQITQVSAEMTQFEQAIASFKALYGVEPPSSLLIPAPATLPAVPVWSAADQSKVRAIWPQFNFDQRGGLPSTVGALHLSGAECLVFFLGGRAAGTVGSAQMIGFSKNPETPWSDAGTNREGPFFEFDIGRTVDVDSDGAFEYLDPLPAQVTPYLYLCSQGKNYTVVNTSAPDDFDVFPSAEPTLGDRTSSPVFRNMAFPYVKADAKTPVRRDFQIISAGLDGRYGIGGVYVNGNELVDVSKANTGDTADGDTYDILDLKTPAHPSGDGFLRPEDLTEMRASEADNIANFSGGTLR
jgi:prepilin-type N-terminal cleavage/methylation domain-containing protein